jgi:starch phosphorylase
MPGWIRRGAPTTRGKRVYYLSLEFLIGRLMRDALSNMGLTNEMAKALRDHGLDLAQLEELEPDAALGNGGLGRLAACFMESLASLDIPAYGYGIRYLNGMFRQRIDDGWQVELPETWLSHGNPWEFDRRESSYFVGFGGEVGESASGGVTWHPQEQIEASAIDTPVAGWRGKREHAAPVDGQCARSAAARCLQRGRPCRGLAGAGAGQQPVRVLYPADSTPAGQELRLRQEYFSSASIQDIVRAMRSMMRTSAPCRTAPRSSSTTPTPAWPWPS